MTARSMWDPMGLVLCDIFINAIWNKHRPVKFAERGRIVVCSLKRVGEAWEQSTRVTARRKEQINPLFSCWVRHNVLVLDNSKKWGKKILQQWGNADRSPGERGSLFLEWHWLLIFCVEVDDSPQPCFLCCSEKPLALTPRGSPCPHKNLRWETACSCSAGCSWSELWEWANAV